MLGIALELGDNGDLTYALLGENKVLSKSSHSTTHTKLEHTQSLQYLFSVCCSSLVQLSYRDKTDALSDSSTLPSTDLLCLFKCPSLQLLGAIRGRGVCVLTGSLCCTHSCLWASGCEYRSKRPLQLICPVGPCRSCQRSVSFFNLLLKCRFPYFSPPQCTACTLG